MTPEKHDLADEERAQRDYEETYGRGGGEAFEARDYPQSYSRPDAGGWRRALRAYVNGHDRGWESDRKLEVADAAVDEARPGREETPRRVPGPEADSEEAGGEATGRTGRGGTPFGVEIPERDRLVFHRSASTWRDRLPRADRFPRHADPALDGRKGTGDQA